MALGYNASTQKIEAFVDGKKQSFGDTLPVGTILPYVGSTANIPSGWALCNGANGTPNLTGRFLEGVTSASAAKKSKDAGLPNIKGQLAADDIFAYLTYQVRNNNAFLGHSSQHGTDYTTDCMNEDAGGSYIYFDASRYNSIYGNSTTVQPNSYTVMYIMKIK